MTESEKNPTMSDLIGYIPQHALQIAFSRPRYIAPPNATKKEEIIELISAISDELQESQLRAPLKRLVLGTPQDDLEKAKALLAEFERSDFDDATLDFIWRLLNVYMWDWVWKTFIDRDAWHATQKQIVNLDPMTADEQQLGENLDQAHQHQKIIEQRMRNSKAKQIKKTADTQKAAKESAAQKRKIKEVAGKYWDDKNYGCSKSIQGVFNREMLDLQKYLENDYGVKRKLSTIRQWIHYKDGRAVFKK